MPALETSRLIIRHFTLDDLDAIHRILDVELRDADFGSEHAQTLNARRTWLQWSVLNYEQLAQLYQPPYGDRAIVLKTTGEPIGACGYVPSFGAFGQLPSWHESHRLYHTPEFGLYYALSPKHQRHGYATEAAQALIDYAFQTLKLKRIIATTTHDNAASQRVMQKLGMTIQRNPYPDPHYLQVVGVLENPM
jgi:RimJ/RimL family protein N-acetyltransferase